LIKDAMNILIVVHGYPPTHSAGAERRAERMALWFTKNGHHVEVFAVEAANDPNFRVTTSYQDGYIVHRLYFDAQGDPDDPLTRLYDYQPITVEIERVINRQQFDIVHIVSGYLLGVQAVKAAKNAGIPVVLTLTEFWFMCACLNLVQPTQVLCSGPESHEKCARCLMEYKRRYRLPALWAPSVMDLIWPIMHRASLSARMKDIVERRDITLRRTIEQVDLVICPSNYLLQMFADYGFDTSNFRFMRQGLQKPTHKINRVNHNDGILRLGYVGQIKPHKGVDLLVDALLPLIASGEPVEIDIWGSETENPAYVETLKSRSVGVSNQIRWRGPYRGDTVWDVMSAMDVLTVPSRWYENSPNAILEAYEMGIPVIAADRGGMAELVIHEQSGLLFKLDDADDLRHQIVRLLIQPKLLEKLRGGIPPVKSIADEIEGIIEEYDTLLTKAATDETLPSRPTS